MVELKKIPREPVFTPEILTLKKASGLPYPLREEFVYLFGYGRVALYEGLKILQIKETENVLVPDYICNVVLSPMYRMNIKVRFYEVDNALKPVWPSLEQRIDKYTKALLIVNYFGFPNDIDIARHLCDKHGIYLIEDNAHSFLSSYNGNPMGSTGDISFFSFRKMVPIPNGAALVVNNRSLSGRLSNPGHLLRNNRSLRFLAKSLFGHRDMKETDFEASRVKHICEEYNIENYFTKFSRCGYLFMNHFNFEYIKEQRRKTYSRWLEYFSDRKKESIKIVFPFLNSGVTPSSFPVLVEDRGEFISKMWRNGIECFPWPYLPEGSKEEYLSRHLVCLPVFPYFNPKDILKGSA